MNADRPPNLDGSEPYNNKVAMCALCELDDSMCAHSPGARRVQERESRRARPKPAQRDFWGAGPYSSNLGWDGAPLRAAEFLREPRHRGVAELQIEMAAEFYCCGCDGCRDAGSSYIDRSAPEIEALSEYSNVALQRANAVLGNRDADLDHTPAPSLREWLETLRDLHAAAWEVEADQQDLDHATAERSRSQKPPERWLGRSPGYYSRGH